MPLMIHLQTERETTDYVATKRKIFQRYSFNKKAVTETSRDLQSTMDVVI